jgi:hypothetical protein
MFPFTGNTIYLPYFPLFLISNDYLSKQTEILKYLVELHLLETKTHPLDSPADNLKPSKEDSTHEGRFTSVVRIFRGKRCKWLQSTPVGSHTSVEHDQEAGSPEDNGASRKGFQKAENLRDFELQRV